MSNPEPTVDWQTVLARIAAAPNGMSIDSLQAALDTQFSRRTLQRRLAQAVALGQVQTLGTGRGLRYKIVRPQKRNPQHGTTQSTEKAHRALVLSSVSEKIRQHIIQPRHLRTPLGYQVGFLEAYQPNKTAYLPAATRTQLLEMGRTPMQPAIAGTFAKDMLSRLLIDLSWASSHLEGNTYSRLDTARLIEHGQAADGKDALETQMILNHKQAVEYLVLNPEHAKVNVATVTALHALLADGLMADPMAVGRIRSRAVEIGGSVYLPVALPQRVEDLFGIVVRMAAEIADPFEQAFFLMVHLPYLQPFEDVNKRVSRLAANIPFFQHNLCPLSFIDVPQQSYVDAMLCVYELNRVEPLCDVFVWAYERSCQQYVAVKQNITLPDLFRLKHRQALAQVVAQLVRELAAPTESAIQSAMPDAVEPTDQERFVKLVQNEFKALHAGNAVRFGIRPLELEAWQAQMR